MVSAAPSTLGTPTTPRTGLTRPATRTSSTSPTWRAVRTRQVAGASGTRSSNASPAAIGPTMDPAGTMELCSSIPIRGTATAATSSPTTPTKRNRGSRSRLPSACLPDRAGLRGLRVRVRRATCERASTL